MKQIWFYVSVIRHGLWWEHSKSYVDIKYFVVPGLSRTTRMSAFWDTPTTTPWLPILVINIRSRVKTRQSQSYKFKKIAKNSNFEILQQTLHTTHLLKLLDKMCKYEMDPTRTVDATERKQDVGQTDGQTDRQTDGRSETNIPPYNFIVQGV